jgi:hypothetical protein
MPAKKISPEVLQETLRVFESCNREISVAASQLNIARNSMYHRLEQAKALFPSGLPGIPMKKWTYPRMKSIDAPNTKWIVGSDFHVWDAEPTLIYKAFCKIAKDIKADGIIMNGDVIDGARISRHGLMRGSSAPKIDVEIDAAKKLFKMLPKSKYKLWTIGNHDIRIDNYVAANAGELSDYIISLQEHFPDWDMAYAFDINNTEVRHRFRGGIHAAWNNTLHSGVNILTGHTHQLQIMAARDRKGTRYGIETGLLADPYAPQFEYTEGAPGRWRQGFVVITFDEDGYMLPPELCEMVRGRPVFRGSHVF